MGVVALVVGAGLAGVWLMHWGRPAEPSPPQEVAALGASSSAGVAAESSAAMWAPVPTESPVTAVSAAVVPPPPHVGSAASHAPTSPQVASPTADSAAPAGVVGAPPAVVAVADAAPASPGFNLVTSAATPAVVKATGVSAHDVRAALPSWKFTQCYRDALTHANKALAGHVTLTLTIDAAGNVTRVGARGAGPLLSGTGDCLIDAMSHVTLANPPASGGTADVDVDCTPR
jgi:hypothetical protein